MNTPMETELMQEVLPQPSGRREWLSWGTPFWGWKLVAEYRVDLMKLTVYHLIKEHEGERRLLVERIAPSIYKNGYKKDHDEVLQELLWEMESVGMTSSISAMETAIENVAYRFGWRGHDAIHL